MRPRALVLGAALLCATSCKGELCPRVRERLATCVDGGKPHAEVCELDDEPLQACVGQATCEEFITCIDALELEHKARGQASEVASAKAKSDADTLESLCLHPEGEPLIEACDEAMPMLLASLRAKVEGVRDEASPPDLEACNDLRVAAKRVSADEVKAAERLCKEARVASLVGKALTDARAFTDAKKTDDLPYECQGAVEELDRIDSAWAKDKRDEVIKACYHELGIVVLTARLPNMTLSCDYTVEQVYQAVKTHGLTGPKLDPLIAKASKLCDTE